MVRLQHEGLVPENATLLAFALASRGFATRPTAIVAYRFDGMDGPGSRVVHFVGLDEKFDRFQGSYLGSDADAMAEFSRRVARDQRYLQGGTSLTAANLIDGLVPEAVGG